MKDTFTSYVFCYDGGGSPSLVQGNCTVTAGQPLDPGTDSGHIYLAGGFASTMPDTPFPLSPTLQLNGDLGVFDDTEIHSIAAAELARNGSNSWHSYTMEADTRVVVLGNSPAQLDDFVNTHGGVLDCEPLLLKGYHPDFTTVTNLVIRQDGKGPELTFQVRTPVHLESCTYCGLCGPVCPEDCLDENLFLDLDRCSFCNACVEVCPHGAIELHSAENRSLEAPTLLLLEGVNVELPSKRSKIYTTETFDQLLASIYTCQIDEVVSCDNQLCHYIGRMSLGCDRCFTACRHAAIIRDSEGVTVDQIRCVECGECIGACPTGAMQYKRFNDQSFIEYFRKITLTGYRIVIGDEQQLHRLWWRNQGQHHPQVFFLEYPNVNALTPMHLFHFLDRGANSIILLEEEGQAATSPIHQSVAMVNSICKELCDIEDAVALQPVSAFNPALQAVPNSPLVTKRAEKGFTNRRQQLASSLHHCSTTIEKELHLGGEIFSDFGTVLCDTQKCTLCLACLNVCRIESLSGDAEQFALMHKKSLCVQCGSCAEVCPENALSLQAGLDLNNAYLDTIQLAKTEQMACAGCGKVFGTKKSYERVMQLLAGKNMLDEDRDLFEYCDKCRVIQMFERNQ